MDDMYLHFSNLKPHLSDGGRLFYIVGNSKFYDTLVPVEQFYAEMMKNVGFADIRVEKIRKTKLKERTLRISPFRREGNVLTFQIQVKFEST